MLVCDAVKSADPTGTADVRRRYSADFRRRWNAVARLTAEVLAKQDILGINPASAVSVLLAASVATQNAGLSPGALASLGAESKLRAFQAWFDQTLARVVLGDGKWLRDMVGTSYKRAVNRGMRLTKKSVVPEHMDERIDALYAFAYTETQGVMEAVSQRAMRSVAEGLLNNERPPQIVRRIRQAFSAVGIVRSRALVETMVVKAHSTGTLDQFQAAGVRRVGLLPEIIAAAPSLVADAPAPSFTGPGARRGTSRRTVQRIRAAQRRVEALGRVNIETAGDDDVCPICEDLEAGGPYDIDEARSLIPAHPHCRCAFVPADDDVEDGIRDEFDPNQPRNEKGEWEEGGGGGGGVSADKAIGTFKQLALEQVDKGQHITKEQQAAVNFYTQASLDNNRSAFSEINSALREGRSLDGKLKDVVSKMDAAFEKAPSLPERTDLYRGLQTDTLNGLTLSGDPKGLVGKTISDKAFMSTTANPNTGHAAATGQYTNFGASGGDHNVLMKINAPEGTRVLVGERSSREYILPRGTALKITEARRESGVLHLTADLLRP